MTPFGKWLADIGLESHDVVFASNKIDFDVIRSLTDADLRELGLPLSDRKRLLQAVATLDGQQATATDTSTVTTPSTPPHEAATPLGGERRQLTVMFCDLVGRGSSCPRNRSGSSRPWCRWTTPSPPPGWTRDGSIATTAARAAHRLT
jgi:SAM domain (Sterile alpha motif)